MENKEACILLKDIMRGRHSLLRSLRFKDFNAMIYFLLAKQTWRIIENPIAYGLKIGSIYTVVTQLKILVCGKERGDS